MFKLRKFTILRIRKKHLAMMMPLQFHKDNCTPLQSEAFKLSADSKLDCPPPL